MHRVRFTYANVLSTLALFVVLGGVSAAAVKFPRASVGTVQLKANAVTTKKVRDGSLTAADFAQGQLASASVGERGPAGPQGPAGATGAQGPQGNPGPLVHALPSGESLTGMYGFGGTVSAGGAQRATITFAFPLEADIDAVHVHVVARTDAPSSDCPGSLAAPKAAPGHLCIYNGGPYTPTAMNPFTSSSGEASRFGAELQVTRPDAGLLTAFGSWAVTAP